MPSTARRLVGFLLMALCRDLPLHPVFVHP